MCDTYAIRVIFGHGWVATPVFEYLLPHYNLSVSNITLTLWCTPFNRSLCIHSFIWNVTQGLKGGGGFVGKKDRLHNPFEMCVMLARTRCAGTWYRSVVLEAPRSFVPSCSCSACRSAYRYGRGRVEYCFSDLSTPTFDFSFVVLCQAFLILNHHEQSKGKR